MLSRFFSLFWASNTRELEHVVWCTPSLNPDDCSCEEQGSKVPNARGTLTSRCGVTSQQAVGVEHLQVEFCSLTGDATAWLRADLPLTQGLNGGPIRPFQIRPSYNHLVVLS